MRALNGNAVLKILLALVLIAGAAYFALAGFRDSAMVAEIQRGMAVDAVPGSIVVHADKDLQELKIEGAGRVIDCARLDPGAFFKEGEVLLKLDTSDLERSLADVNRVYESNRALARIKDNRTLEKELAEQRLANAQKMFELDYVSVEDVNTARRALEAVLTNIKVSDFTEKKEAEDHKRTVEQFEAQLKKMTVVAPADGMIEGVRVNVGALVGGGERVATFYSNKRVVVAKISEEDIAKVKLGDPAKVQLLTFPGRDFEARVSKLLPFADPETRRYSVFLEVKAEVAELLPNSTGEVTITVGSHANVPLVPRRAVFSGNMVLVVKDGRVERRQIEIGFRGLNTAEVAKGLAPGEKVIVENLDQFRPGQRVRVDSSS